MEPGEIENTNFSVQHHVLRSKSSDQDPFIQASFRRKSLAQFFYGSQSLCDTDGICQVVEKRSRLYYGLVDERSNKSINNYADSALVVAATAGKNDATKWKSNLRSKRPVFSVVQKLMDCPGKCATLEVLEQDLKLVANSRAKENKGSFQNKGRFVPKTAVVSQPCGFGREPPHQNMPLNVVKNGRSGVEPSTRGNLLNIALENKETFTGSSTGQWRPQQSNFCPSGVGVTCSDTDDNSGGGGGQWQPQQSISRASCAGPSRNGSDEFALSGKGIPPSNNFTRNPVFSARAPNNMGPRFGGGSVNAGNPYIARGGNHNNHGNGCNRNSVQTGQPNIQSTQQDTGISSISASIFRTARDELTVQNQKKYGNRGGANNSYAIGRGGGGGAAQKRSLGTRRAGVTGQFVPPIKPTDEDDFGGMFGVKQPGMEGEMGDEIDDRLKNIDPKMVETIRNEIMDIGSPVEWDDIAGLEFAKTTIQEIVVWPLLRPDIFTGLRKPPKGLLLFGPPGTGKTLIGKCIASQSQSTFFSISASSLTSKWIGDGEKMVRALFAVAKVHQPAVVFIDEIDSLLTQRSDSEHESSRRIKTEFLVQLDGAGTGDEERILVVGATNRPQELDEAARRRLVKRLYIPLPEASARRQIVERLMSKERNALDDHEIDEIAALTEGYSGADMKNLCQEASLGPIRSISFSAMHQITADQVRPITVDDFKTALQRVRASVSNRDLEAYVLWDKTYGMGSGL